MNVNFEKAWKTGAIIMDRVIYYETNSSGIPEILNNDWGMIFELENDKEIAIKIFEWKYGPQDTYANMKIESWQDGSRVKFTKGFFDGKLSFSLNKDKVLIVKLMIMIIKFTIGSPSASHYISTGLSMSEFFHSAFNVYILPNNIQRCILLKIIELSNNNSNNPVNKNIIYNLYRDSKICYNDEVFECTDYNKHEHSCFANNDTIDLNLVNLEEKKVIRIVNSDIYIR